MSGAANDTSKNKLVYYLKATDNSPHILAIFAGIMDPVKTLIDSGSSRNFIDIAFARRHSLPLTELQHPRKVIAIDRKEVADKIRFRCRIGFEIQGKTFSEKFYAMPLGGTPAILGQEWLQKHNPDISWKTLEIKYRDEQQGPGREEETPSNTDISSPQTPRERRAAREEG